MLDPAGCYQLDEIGEIIRKLVRLRREWKTRLDRAAAWNSFDWHEHEDMQCVSFDRCVSVAFTIPYRSRPTYNNSTFDEFEAASSTLKGIAVKMQETLSYLDETTGRFRNAEKLLHDCVSAVEVFPGAVR